MSYTPLTDAFFYAMGGALAAQGAAGRSITSSDETTYARQALATFAFAQQFDTEWGDSAPDLLEQIGIQAACLGYWRDRDDASTVPTHYSQVCMDIIALIREGDAVAIDGGATPPSGGGEALASAWGSGTSALFDGGGEIGATATGTPQSTGLIRAWLDLTIFANDELVFVMSVTQGAGVLSPGLFGFTNEVAGSTGAYPSFVVDLDRLETPFIAPIGEPLILNLVGKTAGGTANEILGTIAWQERSE
jgi:hypothetical protein